MNGGTGYMPDIYDARDRAFHLLGVGTPTPVQAELTLLEHAPPARDQGLTNSCVGQSAKTAFWIACRSMGIPVEEPSELFPYANGRHQHQRPDVPLKDTGTFIRFTIRGMQKHGICREEVWPFLPWKMERGMEFGSPVDIPRIKARPPYSAVKDGWMHRGPRGYYRIMTFGQRMLDDMDSALVHGLPFIAGLVVTRGFLEHRGSEFREMTGPVAGGHAMAFIGRRRDQAGDRWYLAHNSHGKFWGQDGLTWIHQDVMKGAMDVWVVDP